MFRAASDESLVQSQVSGLRRLDFGFSLSAIAVATQLPEMFAIGVGVRGA